MEVPQLCMKILSEDFCLLLISFHPGSICAASLFCKHLLYKSWEEVYMGMNRFFVDDSHVLRPSVCARGFVLGFGHGNFNRVSNSNEF